MSNENNTPEIRMSHMGIGWEPGYGNRRITDNPWNQPFKPYIPNNDIADMDSITEEIKKIALNRLERNEPDYRLDEFNSSVIIRVKLAGFSSDDIEVQYDTSYLTINALLPEDTDGKEDSDDFISDKNLMIELPTGCSSPTCTFQNGLMTIKFKKTGSKKKIKIEQR